MNDKLDAYVDGVFAPYEGAKSVAELKTDLLADLHERYRELKAEGKDDATAFDLTVDSIGDIEQTVQEVSNLSRSLERQLVTTFDASELREATSQASRPSAGSSRRARCAAPTSRMPISPAARSRPAMWPTPTSTALI